MHPLHKFWGWCHQPHFHMRVQLNIWPKVLRVESPCSPQPCVIPTQQPTPIPSVTTTHLNASIIMIQGINVLIKMLLPICYNNKHQIHQTCSLCQLYTTSSMKSLAKRNVWYSSSRKFHDIWNKSLSNKLGYLTDGICDIKACRQCFLFTKTNLLWTELLPLSITDQKRMTTMCVYDSWRQQTPVPLWCKFTSSRTDRCKVNFQQYHFHRKCQIYVHWYQKIFSQ